MTRTVVLSLFNIEDMSFWYDENLDFFMYKILNHKTLFSTKPFNNDNFIVVLYFGKIVNYRLLLMNGSPENQK